MSYICCFYYVNLDMPILMVILIVFQFFHEVIRKCTIKDYNPPPISLPNSNGHAFTKWNAWLGLETKVKYFNKFNTNSTIE